MRYLSGKEKKELNTKIPQGYSIDKKDEITQKDEVLYKNKEPYLIELEGIFIPHLKSIKSENSLKEIHIDHGAIPFLLKGADMMRPGITFIDDDILEGEIIIIKDEVKKISLGIGRAIYNSEDMKNQEKGKSIIVEHT